MAATPPFCIATSQLHGDLNKTGNHLQTTPRTPWFWYGDFFTFEPANLVSIGGNHTMSDSAAKVMRIIQWLDYIYLHDFAKKPKT